MKAVRWHAAKHPFDANVFIEVGPMDAVAGRRDFKTGNLVRRGGGKAF